MTEQLEKYVRLNIEFPNKAGKLASVLATQKRLIESLSKTKQSTNVQQLLISAAEGYDVAQDLLEYMKTTLQEVANDSQTLIEGARMRNTIYLQSVFISELMESRDKWWMDKAKERGLMK